MSWALSSIFSPTLGFRSASPRTRRNLGKLQQFSRKSRAPTMGVKAQNPKLKAQDKLQAPNSAYAEGPAGVPGHNTFEAWCFSGALSFEVWIYKPCFRQIKLLCCSCDWKRMTVKQA